MENEKFTITDPKAWMDFMQRIHENWHRYFVDGRKVVKPNWLRVLYFKYVEPEDKEYKCSDCHGSGKMYSPYHRATEGEAFVKCPTCGGSKSVIRPSGPGVSGHGILIEEGLVAVTTMVGGEIVNKRFLYRRGILGMDNRTGGSRFDEIEKQT